MVRTVPFHPAGRYPERKVTHPSTVSMPGKTTAEEQALLEALAKLPTPAARWSHLYDESEASIIARLTDPWELGDAYEPLGGWEAVAAAGVGDPIESQHTWILFGSGPVASALKAVNPGLVVLTATTPEAQAKQALEALPGPADRAVLLGEGEGAHQLLAALVSHVELRNRTIAVVSVGGVLGGYTDREGPYSAAVLEDWMARWYRQVELEPEVVQPVPYLSLQWLDRQADPPGIPGLPIKHQRFAEPSSEGASEFPIEPVDLGVLEPSSEPDLQLVALALVLLTESWVAARRG